jgi:hypothetical protein
MRRVPLAYYRDTLESLRYFISLCRRAVVTKEEEQVLSVRVSSKPSTSKHDSALASSFADISILSQ